MIQWFLVYTESYATILQSNLRTFSSPQRESPPPWASGPHLPYPSSRPIQALTCSLHLFSSVQFSHSVVSDSAIPWTAAHQASLSTSNFWSLLKLMSIGLVMPSHPLVSPSPPAFNLSQHQGLFQWVSSSHQVAKVLEFQHQSFQWIFRTDLL